MAKQNQNQAQGTRQQNPRQDADASRALPEPLGDGSLTWGSEYEAALRSSPHERVVAARRLLADAQNAFGENDPRIAMSLELLADARIASCGEVTQEDVGLFGRACSVFASGSGRGAPTSYEHVRVQAKSAHCLELLSSSESQLLSAVAEYRKFFNLLAGCECAKFSPQQTLQLLSVARRATGLFLASLYESGAVIAETIRAMTKSLGLPNERNIEKLTDSQAFKGLPSLSRSVLHGMLVNYYSALEDGWGQKTTTALHRQIQALESALEEYSGILESDGQNLFRDESSFEREIKKELLLALELQCNCEMENDDFEQAHAILEQAADLEIPGRAWLRAGLLRCVEDLRGEFVRQKNYRVVAALCSIESRVLIEGGQIEAGLEALGHAHVNNNYCGEYDKSRECCSKALRIIEEQLPTERAHLRSLEAQFLLAQSVLCERAEGQLEHPLEFLEEEAALLRLAEIAGDQEESEDVESHFFARKRLIEICLVNGSQERAETHLEACIAQLGGESGDPKPMEVATSIKAHRIFGVLCQEFDADKKRIGRILLQRGLEIASTSAQASRAELFGLLRGLAFAFSMSDRHREEGLNFAHRGLALYSSPDEQVSAQMILELMRVKLGLLEELGQRDKAKEFELQVDRFCQLYDLV